MTVIHGARIRLRRRKFKLCTRLTIISSTIILFIGLLVISAMYIHLQSVLNSIKIIKDDGNSIFKPVDTQDEHDPRRHNYHNDSKKGEDVNTQSATRLVESEEVPLTPFTEYTNEKEMHKKATRTWIDADSQIIHTYDANTNVEMFNPRIHFRDRFDHTKSSLEQRKSAIYTTEPVEPFDGNDYVKWKSQYKPLDEYKMPVFATIKERNTLNHASIFISIAAFRDSECAPTIESALRRARSPHRIYAGISEERFANDVDCLSQLHLNESALARRLLYGEHAPSSLSYELRNLTWEEIMRDRGSIATNVDDMNARISTTTTNTTTTTTTTTSLSTSSATPSSSSSSLNELLHSISSQTLSANVQHYNTDERISETFDKKVTSNNEDKANQTQQQQEQQHKQPFTNKELQESVSMLSLSENVIDNTQTSQQVQLQHSATENLLRVQNNREGIHAVKLLNEDQVDHAVHNTNGGDDNNYNKLAIKIYLDPSYTTELITCVAGTMETQRDRYLLSQMHNNSLVSSRFRRGRGGAQERWSPALAGCRITRRVTDPNNARGPTFGRYMTSLFYFNQDYYMMVDSHSRFSLHWDAKMITRLFQTPTRGVLSHYPNGYTPEKPEEEYNKNDVMTMCKGVILKNGMPKLGANWMPNRPQPVIEAFAAAGYTFGDAVHVLEVPFDPFLHYMFDGEEILYSARLWTTGFDLYGPGEANVFHYYGRPNAPKYWSYLTGERSNIMRRSERRALYLLHRAQPWAQVKEDAQANAPHTQVDNSSTQTTEMPYILPEQRLIVDEQTAQREWPLNILSEYYGAGKVRTLEEYWKFTQLTDEFVNMRDSEKRWQGGQGLCKNL